MILRIFLRSRIDPFILTLPDDNRAGLEEMFGSGAPGTFYTLKAPGLGPTIVVARDDLALVQIGE